MNETLSNKPHAASKQTCTVKACLHLLIISADALLCISISYTQILCFARKENIMGQSRSQPKWPASTSLLATPCMHAWVRLRKHRCRCSYHRLPQIISHQVRHNLRCAQLWPASGMHMLSVVRFQNSFDKEGRKEGRKEGIVSIYIQNPVSSSRSKEFLRCVADGHWKRTTTSSA